MVFCCQYYFPIKTASTLSSAEIASCHMEFHQCVYLSTYQKYCMMHRIMTVLPQCSKCLTVKAKSSLLKQVLIGRSLKTFLSPRYSTRIQQSVQNRQLKPFPRGLKCRKNFVKWSWWFQWVLDQAHNKVKTSKYVWIGR